MPIDGLDHVNVRTDDLARARRFYRDVLGLREGERPPFPAPGAWLYAGDAPVVHLVEDASAQPGSTAPLDHVAFRAHDLAAVVRRLEAAGIPFDYHEVPGRDACQVFVRDPDGVRIELAFGPGETPPERLRRT